MKPFVIVILFVVNSVFGQNHLINADSSKFQVTSNFPTSNQNNVPLNSEIIVNFNSDIDATTLDATKSFVVMGEKHGLFNGIFSGGGTSSIAYTLNDDFYPGEIINVTLTSGIKNSDGISLEPTVFRFTAEAPSGEGIFSSDIIISSKGTYSLCSADIDNDGDLDIISETSWYENGNNWNETLIPDEGFTSICAVDIDNDGDLDLVASTITERNINWYENGNNWNKTVISELSAYTPSISAADIDGDGDMDIVAASQIGASELDENDDVIVWYENGNSWQETILSDSTWGVLSVFLADMDNDGKLDVLASPIGTHTDGFKLAWYQNGNNWNQLTIPRSIDFSNSASAADFNNDGYIDILSASEYNGKLTWYDNQNNWMNNSIPSSLDGIISSYTADVDGDGDLDIVASVYRENKIVWNENGNNWEEHSIPSTTEGSKTVLVVDIDNDGDMDVITASENRITWHKNGMPVEFKSFTAFEESEEVTLNWQTTYDNIISGFEIERQLTVLGMYKYDWETVGYLESLEISSSQRAYQFIDTLSISIDPELSINAIDSLEYRLKIISNDSTFTYYPQTVKVENKITKIEDNPLLNELPTEYRLKQNYPNPFNPTTKINYSIPAVGTRNGVSVQLIIYDLLGRNIKTLVNKEQTAGSYSVTLNANGLPSGVYIYKLTAGNFVDSKKLMLLK